MGSLYWQLETPLISHWVSCSSFWVHLFWYTINHENEQKKLCFFAFKKTQCVFFPATWASPLWMNFLSHTHSNKKVLFLIQFLQNIFILSINFTTTPMKFLPKFGNQKLTLDLVINTYTPWSQWKKNIQPFLCCQVQKNCDTLWYGTHHTHNTRLHTT
jgi:hypothetical protein